MAKPSKQRPWVIEMRPPNATGFKWYELDAYRSEDEARLQLALMQKRAPEAEFQLKFYDE
jgi:hypothetical protein